jgi:hypothetical protein
MNIVIVIALVVVLAALAAAGFFMVRGGGNTSDEGASTDAADAQRKRMARALTVRIGVSVLLFLAILLAWYFGLLKPGGLPMRAS